MSFTRPPRSMKMFWGLMSRWMTPIRWAAVSASHTCMPIRNVSASGREVLRADFAEVLALEQLHGEEVQPLSLDVGAAELEHLHDVGVPDLSRDADLVLEPGDELVLAGEVGPDDLERDVLAELLVLGGEDIAHAPRADLPQDAVAAREDVAGRKDPHRSSLMVPQARCEGPPAGPPAGMR